MTTPHWKSKQRFRNVTWGLGLGLTPTAAKLVVRVVNTLQLSTRIGFNGKLLTLLNWAGCQRVAQRVHPDI